MDKLAARYDIVVNIQGDEPLLEPEIIDEVVAALQAAPDAVYRWRGTLLCSSVASLFCSGQDHYRKQAADRRHMFLADHGPPVRS